MERSNTAPYDIENPSIETAVIEMIEIRARLMDDLFCITSNSTDCSIYRVPERLRSMNEKAYTPRVVSIGPFHHGNDRLQAMEEQKMLYLRNFQRRANIPLDYYINKVAGVERRLRSCYAYTFGMRSGQFVRIICVDAIFIIELLLRFRSDNRHVENDRIFERTFLINDIWPDMLLLENQLPFFILDLFLEAAFDQGPISLISLSRDFFAEALHTLGEKDNWESSIYDADVAHFLDFVRLLCPVKAEESIPDGKRSSTTLPCISQLHRAGVNFKVGPATNLFDIRFVHGTLEIPKLEINDVTEIIIRNLIALEECHYPWNNMISTYALIMDRFVNTSRDVELLVEHGIFENMLGNDGEVATMINTLGSGVSAMGCNVYYGTLYKGLNEHYKKPSNRWKANLRQIYFDTPWTTMKVIAAVVLLILTLIQTVCSIMSLT